jgi:hypothetical protein
MSACCLVSRLHFFTFTFRSCSLRSAHFDIHLACNPAYFFFGLTYHTWWFCNLPSRSQIHLLCSPPHVLQAPHFTPLCFNLFPFSVMRMPRRRQGIGVQQPGRAPAWLACHTSAYCSIVIANGTVRALTGGNRRSLALARMAAKVQ